MSETASSLRGNSVRPWIKLYCRVLGDPKFMNVSEADFGRWVKCLLIGGEYGDETGRLPSLNAIAYALRAPLSDVQASLERLVSEGLIDRKAGGSGGITYYIHDWEQWQKSATSKSSTKGERSSNGDEAPSGRSSRARTREEESRIDKNREDSLSVAAPSGPRRVSDEDWKNFQIAYPQREGDQGWPQARDIIEEAIASGTPWARIIQGANLYFRDMTRAKKRKTKFVKAAATWAKNRGWEEYSETAETPSTPATNAAKEPPKPDLFEPTNNLGWHNRIDSGRRARAWRCDKWGPIPETEGCRVPQEAFDTLHHTGRFPPWEPGEAKDWVDWLEYQRKREEARELIGTED